MIPELNKIQRLFLAAVGFVILLLQLHKFSVDGEIAGGSWIFAFLIVALLWLPVLSLVRMPQRRTPLSDKTKNTASTSIGEFAEFHAAQAENRDLVGAIHAHSETLWNELPLWMQVPDVPSLRPVTTMMVDLWKTHCQAYVFALARATEYKKDINFLSSKRAEYLFAEVAKMMVNTSKSDAQRNPIPDLPFGEESAKKWVIRDLAEAMLASEAFIKALSSQDAVPDRPLIDFLAKKLGVAEGQRMTFDSRLHSFTRDTLAALSSTTS